MTAGATAPSGTPDGAVAPSAEVEIHNPVIEADAGCASCGAPIRWVITLGGKRMPLDPGPPHPAGNVVPRTLPNGDRRVDVLTGDRMPAQEPAWRSHFATCPHAAQHRRRRAATVPRCVGCRGPLDRELLAVAEPGSWEARYHPGCAPATPEETAAHAARVREALAGDIDDGQGTLL